jgi:cytochrome c556
MVAASSCATQPPPAPPQQAQLTRAVSAPQRAEPPQYLPGTARAILQKRMAFHAQDMGDLVSAIMILQYDRVRDRATAIASDANLARPLTGDATELASALPESFFVLQDQLRAQAGVLASAAGEQSAFQVADAYGRLSETCVKCHAVYRQGR